MTVASTTRSWLHRSTRGATRAATRRGRCITSMVDDTLARVPSPSGLEDEPGGTLEIAVDGGLDAPRSDTLQERDSNTQPVWQRWHHHAMEDGAGLQPGSFDAKLSQPAPPALEALEALHR